MTMIGGFERDPDTGALLVTGDGGEGVVGLGISVLAHGARGDGVTDDTAAIQAALDDAADAGGGLVTVPAGVWIVRGLTIGTGVALVGQGPDATTIRLAGDAPSGAHVIATDEFDRLTGTDEEDELGPSGWQVRSLRIDGSAGRGGGCGLAIYGYGYRLQDLAVTSAGVGIWSEWGSAGSLPGLRQMEAEIVGCRVGDCGGTGVAFNGPHDSMIDKLICHRNSGDGLWLGPRALGTQVSLLHVWGLEHEHGVRVEASGAMIHNVQAEGAARAQIAILANDCAVTGANVFNGWADTNVGLVVGDDDHEVAGTRIEAFTHALADGHLDLTHCAGSASYRLRAYADEGEQVVIGHPGWLSRADITVSGGGWSSDTVPSIMAVDRHIVTDPDGQDRYWLDAANAVESHVGLESRWFADWDTQTVRIQAGSGVVEAIGLAVSRRTVSGGTIPGGTTYAGVTGSGARSITLPPADEVPGIVLIVKDEAGNASSGTITISRAGSDTIDGATSVGITTNHGAVRLFSTGAGWAAI